MIRTALVVGCGSIGRRHIGNLRTLGVAEIAALDPDSARLASAVTDLGVRPEHDLEAALDEGPQAVLVCTPPESHLEAALAALDAGTAVFIEKPLAPARRPAMDRLLSHPGASRALVGYNLRYHKGLQLVAELVSGGDLGRVLSVYAEFGQYLPDWRPTRDYRTGYIIRRDGGGILLDASHEIDYVRWLAGEVKGVSAALAKLSDLEMEAEDTALLTLRHQGGALSQVHLDCVQRGYSRGCKVVGTGGTLVWGFLEGVRVTRDGRAWASHPVVPDVNDMYLAEMRHFVDVAEGRATPLVDARSAAAILGVVEAARRSAEERREVSP